MPSVYLYNCSPQDITVSFLNAPQQSPVRIGERKGGAARG